MDWVIPTVAIVMGIGIAFYSLYLEDQRKRLQYEERRLMIEKGITPPPMLPDRPRHSAESSLRAALILICLGVGLMLAAFFPGERPNGLTRLAGTAAPIVLLLGVGNLLYYFMAGKRQSSPM